MVRTEGAYEYRKGAEQIVESYVSTKPQTTIELTRQLRKFVFAKIDFSTVKRLLDHLCEQGKVKKIQISRYTLWQK